MITAVSLAQVQGLNLGGWILMILCVGCVCALGAFCFFRILREPKPSPHHDAPLDLDTRDRDT